MKDDITEEMKKRTDEYFNNLIKEFKQYSDEILESKKKTMDLLRRIGIHDKKGNLTDRYNNSRLKI